MKRVAHHTARWTLSLVFLTLVVIAIVTGAARISLPFVGAYRADIQDYLSQYLGNPVEIGSLELSWRGFGPRLVLEDVILVSGAEQAQDVHLHKILLDVNLLSSWMQDSWQINEMSIVGANLSVEYLGNNKYRVYGRQIDGASSNEATNLDVLGWLMQADMVALLESRVRFIYRQKSIDLEARELNIRAQNNSGLHRIRIDAAIPALSPDVLNVAMDFSGDRQQLLDSNGSFTAALSGADLQALSGLLPSLAPISVSGSAGLELFGKWSDESLQHLRVISRLSAFEVANKTTLKRWSSAG
ncbi:MAG: hypothetical protein KDJ38_09320, partial [Gammaproteobacteria bacterium]|nr:hypothetical protein [Gammaproteobacteria bacterium]